MLWKKVSETLIGVRVWKGYDCLCDLFLNFEETLTSFKFKSLLWILKFTYAENVAKYLLPEVFTKLVSLRILAAGKHL